MAVDEKFKLHVTFWIDSDQIDKKATEEAGRPIHKEVEMVTIKIPGDPKRTLNAPAHSTSIRHPQTNEWVTYAERFPEHYEAFKKNQEQITPGTPLSELTFLSEAKRKDLRAVNIHTAEQLAHLDGPGLQKLGMGARELKNQAEAYLSKAEDNAVEMKLAAENAALKERMESMQAQVNELMSGAQRSPAPVEDEGEPSPFEHMDDATLRAFIKERSGETAGGRASRETLIEKAEAILASEQETEAA